jgi:hypothetical protein
MSTESLKLNTFCLAIVVIMNYDNYRMKSARALSATQKQLASSSVDSEYHANRSKGAVRGDLGCRNNIRGYRTVQQERDNS